VSSAEGLNVHKSEDSLVLEELQRWDLPWLVQQRPRCGEQRGEPFMILQKIQEAILHCPKRLK